MSRSPLETLLKLRKQEMERAEQVFETALANEEQAREAVGAAEDRILQEQQVASSPDCDDTLVEAFGNWLPVGREAVRQARRQEQQLVIDTAVAQAALVAARTAYKTVETLSAQRKEQARQKMLKDEQNQMDDFRRPLHSPL